MGIPEDRADCLGQREVQRMSCEATNALLTLMLATTVVRVLRWSPSLIL